MTADTLLINAIVITGDGATSTPDGWVAVAGDKIVATGQGRPDVEAANVIDVKGALLMPGAIDVHVHFREPGMTDKADIAGESRAAVAGGVTSFMEMPNTVPPTTNMAEVERKRAIAAANSPANYAFYIGATHDNTDSLASVPAGDVAGIKLFVGSTTGNLLMDGQTDLDRLMSTATLPVAVHAEDNATIDRCRRQLLETSGDETGDLPVGLHPDVRSREACIAAARRVIDTARRHGTRLHLAHVSTADELALLDQPGDTASKKITSETCPQYLLFSRRDYDRLGTRIKCNPAIKEETDRLALIEAVKTGLIDIIATDHAPHQPAVKEGGALKAASGMPSVQFAYPLMIDLLGPETAAAAMARNPALAFDIDRRGAIAPGFYADLVIVAPDPGHVISDSDVISRCGWTPYAGMTLNHRVEMTMVNGAIVYSRRDDIPADHAGRGRALGFNRQSTN